MDIWGKGRVPYGTLHVVSVSVRDSNSSRTSGLSYIVTKPQMYQGSCTVPGPAHGSGSLYRSCFDGCISVSIRLLLCSGTCRPFATKKGFCSSTEPFFCQSQPPTALWLIWNMPERAKCTPELCCVMFAGLGDRRNPCGDSCLVLEEAQGRAVASALQLISLVELLKPGVARSTKLSQCCSHMEFVSWVFTQRLSLTYPQPSLVFVAPTWLNKGRESPASTASGACSTALHSLSQVPTMLLVGSLSSQGESHKSCCSP